MKSNEKSCRIRQENPFYKVKQKEPRKMQLG